MINGIINRRSDRRIFQSSGPHQHVVQTLGYKIAAGEIEPGAILPREEILAAELGVSRTALREGLKVLSAKGLIQSRSKVGTRILDPSLWSHLDADVLAWRCEAMPIGDFVLKLVEMREAIEPAAASSAARWRSDLQLDQITIAYQSMVDSSNREDWNRADLAFHRTVLEATNNELMCALFAVIDRSLATYFTMSARSASDFKYSLPLHGSILNSIRNRDSELARSTMLQLISDSRANLTKTVGRRGCE